VLFVLSRAYLVRLEQTDPARFRIIVNIWHALRIRRKARSTTKVGQ